MVWGQWSFLLSFSSCFCLNQYFPATTFCPSAPPRDWSLCCPQAPSEGGREAAGERLPKRGGSGLKIKGFKGLKYHISTSWNSWSNVLGGGGGMFLQVSLLFFVTNKATWCTFPLFCALQCTLKALGEENMDIQCFRTCLKKYCYTKVSRRCFHWQRV